MIRTEESGKSPELLLTILDRGILNSQDTSTCICPKAILLAEREVALFFNKFEQLIQVTIITSVLRLGCASCSPLYV